MTSKTKPCTKLYLTRPVRDNKNFKDAVGPHGTKQTFQAQERPQHMLPYSVSPQQLLQQCMAFIECRCCGLASLHCYSICCPLHCSQKRARDVEQRARKVLRVRTHCLQQHAALKAPICSQTPFPLSEQKKLWHACTLSCLACRVRVPMCFTSCTPTSLPSIHWC